MADLNFSEVKAIVDALEKDQTGVDMRLAVKSRHEVIQMTKPPDFPEWKTRGGAVSVPSPMLIWLAQDIAADISPYPTIPTVTPLGDDTIPAKAKADKLEKWVATWRATCDEGRTVTTDARANQLLTGYIVLLLRCGPPDAKFPWSVETPAYDSCFFPIDRAPFRPNILGRRYRQLVRTMEKGWAKKKQYDSEAEGGKGAWTGDPSLMVWKDGEWTKEGAERPAEGATTSITGANIFEECEVLELYIDGRIYIAAMNSKGDNGEILWKGKSMTKGVPAVVIPGHYSAVGPLSERLQPVLWPHIQMIHIINRVRSERLTRSENNKPDVIVQQSPEMLKAQSVGGQIASGQQATMEAGGPNVITVNGKPMMWSQVPDEDLDKLEQSAWTELNRYINAFSESSEPETVKDATANAFLTNMESKKKKRAPMLAHLDWGWNELAKMALESIEEYDKDFPVYAVRGDEYSEAKRGAVQTIGPEDVEDWEDSFYLMTETRSHSEAEDRARIQDWAYRMTLGISTQREGITAAGYTDEKAQIKALAEEAGIKTVAQAVAEQVALATQERIRLRSGKLIPLTPVQPPAPPPPGGEAPPPEGGTNQMRAAAVPGAVGGSGI